MDTRVKKTLAARNYRKLSVCGNCEHCIVESEPDVRDDYKFYVCYFAPRPLFQGDDYSWSNKVDAWVKDNRVELEGTCDEWNREL